MKMKMNGQAVKRAGLVVVTAWLGVSVAAWGDGLQCGQAQVRLNGRPAPLTSRSVCGFAVVAAPDGPQLAVMGERDGWLASVQGGESIEIAVPLEGLERPGAIVLQAALERGQTADVGMSLDGVGERRVALGGSPTQVRLDIPRPVGQATLRVEVALAEGDAAVRCRGLVWIADGKRQTIRLSLAGPDGRMCPLPPLPPMRPAIQRALIEWDWRMQDGIGTPREPSSFREAIQRALRRGDAFLADLQRRTSLPCELQERWRALRERFRRFEKAGANDLQWESLWLEVHWTRRRIVFSDPLARIGPLLIVKWTPPSFSHQLTQYVGRYARPGGGLFVLEEPGRSMRCRQLVADQLPAGSFLQPDVSYDGRRILFAYCQVRADPEPGLAGQPGRRYHLYEVGADGSHLRQLTDGPYDDFSPRYLPDGRIIFISTRRGGWHRCGGRPGLGCENHTLALANADGSQPRTLSFHETQEWDPAVLSDGRIIYTRWDYVDRHAVYYEQLWTTRPDGSGAAIYFGNNTFNPVGIWEARPVPGSSKVMATAAAHHAMTAGSVILVDVRRGVDGLGSITRLTPDAPFPESETRVPPRGWHAPAGLAGPPPTPVEARRWPGHCYKSPYPLSEKHFLAAYSFDPLIGEPDACSPNMFGLYLVDAFGNKELLYRDLNLSTVWPVPLAPRPRPATLERARLDVAEPAQRPA
ncbi:MAG TPA: hypothetical protein EYH34_01875, partial [Planctomycetes bacterium]|nr:hypothetical protein [Planctomycetota bacterium]